MSKPDCYHSTALIFHRIHAVTESAWHCGTAIIWLVRLHHPDGSPSCIHQVAINMPHSLRFIILKNNW